ncbi:hypothetical protein H4J02_02520 [Protaetiibacter sp. SSC-01]|uniref:hypothetical protein n=1 Tax=Protaetiibacter sp. SSC-01 TaxID=2759943 RepID=UPI00165706CF|nr:hypothetical protein [Protaetiibacter sp. SSC-01]QNO37934.1 hypothetical protein H4J02_02520 [Protaetiibacter sp. SSC-01]
MALSLRSVIPVWVAAALGAAAVLLIAPSSALVWVPVVMAALVLLTFAIQLSLARKEGLVERMVASLSGALGILVVATLIAWLVGGATVGG